MAKLNFLVERANLPAGKIWSIIKACSPYSIQLLCQGWPLLLGLDESEWPQVMLEEVQIRYQEKFLLHQSGDALAQAAQGSGGVTVPGGVQEPWRSGTEGHGLVVGMGWDWI